MTRFLTLVALLTVGCSVEMSAETVKPAGCLNSAKIIGLGSDKTWTANMACEWPQAKLTTSHMPNGQQVLVTCTCPDIPVKDGSSPVLPE